MWSAVVSFATWLWGLVFPPKGDPTTDQLVDSNARAQDQLAQQETANAVDTKADAARAGADATVVRDLAPSDVVDPAANQRIAASFPSEFGSGA